VGTRGVRLSDATQREIRQFPKTTLATCPGCGFGQFLPTWLVGSDFYDDLQSIGTSYYLRDKWEYRQAIADGARLHRALDLGCGVGESFRARLRDECLSCEELWSVEHTRARSRSAGTSTTPCICTARSAISPRPSSLPRTNQ